MKSDIVPGSLLPDYELSDHHGVHRKLSELQHADPRVLVPSRGGFCPKDRRQHEGLVQLYREMQVGYCRLVTISTDSLIETNEFRSGVGANWTFLSDAGRTVQKDLEIAKYTDPDHNPMIPHTLVLEPGLRVYKIYNGCWFLVAPAWRSCVSIFVRCSSAVVPIGTSPASNSALLGQTATKRSFTPTARRERRC
jgi:peroxiredoxin